jgi:hypothetical protein
MPFPTTITGVTTLSKAAGKSGPFVSSSGAVYGVFQNDTNVGDLDIIKLASPEDGFTLAASLTQSGGNPQIFAYAATQLGDNIHIATSIRATGPSEPILYHVFSMSSDTFTTSNEDTGGEGVTPTDANKNIDIAVRSGGPVIGYQGPTVSVMGQKQRATFARKDGPTWTADIAIDDGGEVDFFFCACVLGAGDKVHFVYHDDTNGDALHKSLTSGNVLSAVETYSDSVSDTEDFIIPNPVYYDAGGTERITAAYMTGGELFASEIDNDGVPGAEEQVTDDSPVIDNEQVMASLFVKSDVDRVYALYARQSDGDLYRDENTNSGGWGVDSLEFTGSVTFVSGNFFTREGRPTLAYFITDGGVVKYNELAALADLSGTLADLTVEQNIVDGGKVLVITLTNATWVAAGATFEAQRQNIIDGMDSAQSELTGWNNEVRDKEVVGAVVRTSDTVVTITLTASPAYDITVSEAITVTVPGTAYENDPFDGGDFPAEPLVQVQRIPVPGEFDPFASIGGSGLGGISRNHTPPGTITDYG